MLRRIDGAIRTNRADRVVCGSVDFRCAKGTIVVRSMQCAPATERPAAARDRRFCPIVRILGSLASPPARVTPAILRRPFSAKFLCVSAAYVLSPGTLMSDSAAILPC